MLSPESPTAPPKKHHLDPSSHDSHDSHPAGYSARTSHVCPPSVAVDRADVAYLCAVSLLCPFHLLLPLFTLAYYTCHVASLSHFYDQYPKHPSNQPTSYIHTYGIFSLRTNCATSYRIDSTSHGTTSGPRIILGPILYNIRSLQPSDSVEGY